MPNSSLLDRMLLWHKFIIISVLALILTSIPTYLYMREADKNLDAALLEKEGLAPVATMLKVIQLTQQHRGLSALVLGGIQAAKDERAAKQREADQTYEAMAAIVQNLHDKSIEAAWAPARKDWERLRGEVSGSSISVPQSYEAHTSLVPKLLAVTDLVADYYGLSLDPDLDSYQLIQSMYYQLPYLTEELGKMRAKGAGLLAKGAATAADKLKLSSIIGRVRDRLSQIVGSFNKAATANPEISAKFTASVQEMVGQASAAMQLATERITLSESLDYPGSD